jgi:hypothetical protein
MALDFPASPITGATYAGPGGIIWAYDGLAWMPELAKVFTGSLAVGGVGFFGAIECSDMDHAAGAETGAEAARSRNLHTFGETAHPPLVLHVLCVGGGSQVAPAVVVPDAIDVIDLRWFLPGDQLEDDTVCRPEGTIEFDEGVATVVVVPGDVSRMPGVPSFPFLNALEVFSWADLPSQGPVFRPVAKTCLQINAVRQSSEVWHA